jgi:hypothetical protein
MTRTGRQHIYQGQLRLLIATLSQLARESRLDQRGIGAKSVMALCQEEGASAPSLLGSGVAPPV